MSVYQIKNGCWDFVLQPFNLKALLIINLLGSVYGYYWYANQLGETPWYLWPLVPDSPLSSTLFCISLLLFMSGRLPDTFALLANTMVIKYGIWAVVVNLQYGYLAGDFSLENWILTLSHAGMALEGFIFLNRQLVGRNALLLASTWLVVEDMADYVFGLHPYLFDKSQLPVAVVTAVSLTLFLIWYSKRREVLKV